jgi:hypothetical protein
MKPPLTIPPNGDLFPPDYEFELADGRRVSGREFVDMGWAGRPGKYRIYRGAKKIGTYTNYGPLNDGIISAAKWLGL